MYLRNVNMVLSPSVDNISSCYVRRSTLWRTFQYMLPNKRLIYTIFYVHWLPNLALWSVDREWILANTYVSHWIFGLILHMVFTARQSLYFSHTRLSFYLNGLVCILDLGESSHNIYPKCQMLSWRTKNWPHFINIWDTITSVIPLRSVHEVPS